MTGEDQSERSQELEELVRVELEQREDITGFKLRDADADGIVAELEQEGIVETYLITLEACPDGSDETHWTYLGEKHDELMAGEGLAAPQKLTDFHCCS